MSDGVLVKVNIPDFKRQLDELGMKMETKIAIGALKAAGAVFLKAAKSFAPVLKTPDPRRTAGDLRKSIFLGRSHFGTRDAPQLYIGIHAGRYVSMKRGGRVSGGPMEKALQRKRNIASGAGRIADPFYWRFLEGGWIPRGPGNKFKGGERTRAILRARALAGGASRVSHPFLQPAFTFAENAALDTALEFMTRAIDMVNNER